MKKLVLDFDHNNIENTITIKFYKILIEVVYCSTFVDNLDKYQEINIRNLFRVNHFSYIYFFFHTICLYQV